MKVNKAMKAVDGDYYFGKRPVPFTDAHVATLPPPQDSLDQWIAEIEANVSRHCGGHALKVTQADIHLTEAAFSGDGFHLHYKAPG